MGVHASVKLSSVHEGYPKVVLEGLDENLVKNRDKIRSVIERCGREKGYFDIPIFASF